MGNHPCWRVSRFRGRNYAGMLPTPGSLPPTVGQNPRSPHHHRHRRHVGPRCRSVRHAWGCGGEQGLRSSFRVAAIVEVHLCHHPVCIGRDGERERERESGREETVETYTHRGRRRRGLALRWLGALSCRRPCLGRTACGALSSSPPPRARERGWGGRAIFL